MFNKLNTTLIIQLHLCKCSSSVHHKIHNKTDVSNDESDYIRHQSNDSRAMASKRMQTIAQPPRQESAESHATRHKKSPICDKCNSQTAQDKEPPDAMHHNVGHLDHMSKHRTRTDELMFTDLLLQKLLCRCILCIDQRENEAVSQRVVTSHLPHSIIFITITSMV